MATRLYIPLPSYTSPVSPASPGAWNDVSQATFRRLVHTKFGGTGGGIETDSGVLVTWTAGQSALAEVFVSEPLRGAQVISGTVVARAAPREGALSANARVHAEVFVVSGDGSTVRGTLLAKGAHGWTSELPTQNDWALDVIELGTALSSVNAQDGDRIVVGFGFTDVSGTSPSARLRVRFSGVEPDMEDANADWTLSSSAAGAAWIEFSQDLVFEPTGVIETSLDAAAGAGTGVTDIIGSTPPEAPAQSVSFVAAGVASELLINTTNVNFDVAEPAGIQDGDLCLLAIGFNASTAGVGTIAMATDGLGDDWTLVHQGPSSFGRFEVWGKRFRSSTTTFARIVTTGNSAVTGGVAQMAAFRGVSNVDPITVGAAFVAGGAGANIGPITGVTSPAEGAVVVIGFKRDDWTSVAVLSGDSLTWAEIGEQDTLNGADAGLVWDYALTPDETAVSDKTFTVTGGGSAFGYGVMLALPPTESSIALSDMTADGTGFAFDQGGPMASSLDAAVHDGIGAEELEGAQGDVVLGDLDHDAEGEHFDGAEGPAASTLDDASASGAGALTFDGAVGVQLDDAAGDGDGEVALEGSSAVALEDAATAAAGALALEGALDDSTLGDVAHAGAAEQIFDAGMEDEGLGDVGADAAGEVVVEGSSPVQLDAAAAAADGEAVEPVDGAAASELDPATPASSGGVAVVGESAVLAGDVTGAAQGEHAGPAEGEAHAELDPASSAASGTASDPVDGTVAVALDEAGAAVSGEVAVVGATAVTLDDAAASAVGSSVRGVDTTARIAGTFAGAVAISAVIRSRQTIAGVVPASFTR